MMPTDRADTWCRTCQTFMARFQDSFLCPVCDDRQRKAALAARTALGWAA